MLPPSASSPCVYRPGLAWFCVFSLVWTVCLLYAGGFTTSIEAGMAFLDWPLSNGSLNPEGWLRESDKMAEHSHRLLGATIGMLTLAIAFWVHRTDSRKWMRKLAWGAVGLAVFQGILGGLRVLLDQLNIGTPHNIVAQTFRVLHACTAQVFLCVLASIAAAESRGWIEGASGREPSRALRSAGFLVCGAIFIQLVFGAVMRHNQAALAIPWFPWSTADGALLPSTWNLRSGIHFAHRSWALVVTAVLILFAIRLWRERRVRPSFGLAAPLLVGALALQVYLGALVVWTLRNPHAATIHMLTGAFLFAATWALTFAMQRGRIEGGSPPRNAGATGVHSN